MATLWPENFLNCNFFMEGKEERNKKHTEDFAPLIRRDQTFSYPVIIFSHKFSYWKRHFESAFSKKKKKKEREEERNCLLYPFPASLDGHSAPNLKSDYGGWTGIWNIDVPQVKDSFHVCDLFIASLAIPLLVNVLKETYKALSLTKLVSKREWMNWWWWLCTVPGFK